MSEAEMTMAGGEAEPYARVAETVSSAVFFAGDRAYKLKKPVNLGFLDFSTTAARAAACARETQLNRQFAPDVYLGVAEVRDPDGQVCDHLVVMRRMPAARRLSAMVRSGAPVAEPLRQVARIMAAQHAKAPRRPEIAEQGSRDALRGRWSQNIAQTRQALEALAPAPPVAPAAVDEVERLTLRFLAGRAPLFQARAEGGHVLAGHGDLLADDIFCLDDGPRILDCLDFDDRLRWLDGLDDVAFLAMDLERLGASAAAEQFLSAYGEYSGDPVPASLCHHYVAYRAFVRAKVACLRVGQGERAAGSEARHLTELTLRHLRAGAVTLVMVGGLPGTGKSALAGALADRLGWTVLNSDMIRKELAGLPATASAAAAYGAGIYSPEWTERTYAELARRVRALLACGESVIADASFISAAHRGTMAAAAGDTTAELVQLRCTASRELAARRMKARHAVSDADPEIAAAMAAAVAPWPGATVIDTESGETAAAFDGLLRQALQVIRPHGAEYVWHPARPVMLPG